MSALMQDAMQRRRDRLFHVAHAQSHHRGRTSGCKPRRRLGRSARDRQRDGRTERRACSRLPAKTSAAIRERVREYFDRLQGSRGRIARADHVRHVLGRALRPDYWRPYYELADETARGRRPHVHPGAQPRALNVLLSFESATRRSTSGTCGKTSAALPLAEQKAKLRDPAIKRALVEVAKAPYKGPRIVGAEARPPDWDWLYLMDTMSNDPHARCPDVARERGVHPVEAMIDIALEHDFKEFFRQPMANENQDHVLEMMKHPRSVVTFSDSGRARFADHGHLAANAPARRTGCARSRRSRWKKRCA